MYQVINSLASDPAEATGKSIVAITGANGFIGSRLVAELLRREDVLIRTLVRKSNNALTQHPRLTVIPGDLARVETLTDFLVPGCVVINLAYDFSSTNAENIRSTENLIEICKVQQAKRLIHCSTASVFGRVKQDVLNEETACNPISEYGIAKLTIERLFQVGAAGNFELVNLRPTSVFGPGGPALQKLIKNLESRPVLINYLNSCLFNERNLNLVSVDTVVAAICFILDRGKDVVGQTFIISEDDEVNNNFKHVEQYLFQQIYGRKYALPPVKIPLIVLSSILRLLGRDNTNPHRIFDSRKLRKLGFVTPRPLDRSLNDFVYWATGKINNGRNQV